MLLTRKKAQLLWGPRPCTILYTSVCSSGLWAVPSWWAGSLREVQIITHVSQDFFDCGFVDTTANLTDGGAACTDLGAFSPLASGGPPAILTPSLTQTIAAPHSVSENCADRSAVFT